MIRRYTYRLRVLFTLVLLVALCANFSEELQEKEIHERNEKIEYVYSHNHPLEFEKTFINKGIRRWVLDFHHLKLVSRVLDNDKKLFIKYCQLIHYN